MSREEKEKIEVHVGNVYSVIHCPNSTAKSRIDRAFAIDIPNKEYAARYNHWMKIHGKKHFFVKSKNALPTGLIHIFDEVFGELYDISYSDKRKKPDLYSDLLAEESKLGHGENQITLRDYQVEAVNSSIKSSRGIHNIAVRGGKTEIKAAICNQLRPKEVGSKTKILIMYNNTQLLEQTADRIQMYLEEPVGRIYGGKWKEHRINCISVPKIYRDITKGSKEKKRRAENLIKNTDVLLVDECHRLQSKSYYTIARKCPAYYRFGFSGTPYSNNRYQSYHIISMLGRTLSTISSKDLSDRGYTAEATFVIVENPARPPEMYNSGDYDHHVEEGIIHNCYRNDIICNMASRSVKKGHKTLIIIERIEHGKILSEKLGCKFVWGETGLHERQKTFEEFDYGHLDLLVTNKIAGEGLNIKNIKLLIYASGYKAYTKIIQHSGRALTKKAEDNTCVIVDFYDSFSKYLKAHSEERISIYGELGYDIKYVSPDKILSDELKPGFEKHTVSTRRAVEKREIEEKDLDRLEEALRGG